MPPHPAKLSDGSPDSSHFLVFETKRYLGSWGRKARSIYRKSFCAGLLIQPDLAFYARLDNWSRRDSAYHKPRKSALCLSFYPWTKSRYDSASVANSKSIALKFLHVLGQTIVSRPSALRADRRLSLNESSWSSFSEMRSESSNLDTPGQW
jgi:hypothetical protein